MYMYMYMYMYVHTCAVNVCVHVHRNIIKFYLSAPSVSSFFPPFSLNPLDLATQITLISLYQPVGCTCTLHAVCVQNQLKHSSCTCSIRTSIYQKMQ